jgi:hypothetical protein
MFDNNSLILMSIVGIILLYMFYKNNTEGFEDDRINSQIGLTHVYCDGKYCSKGAIYNFINKEPIERYQDLLYEFGEPTTLMDEPYGLARWSHPDIFEEIVLKDEKIKHKTGTPHFDFLYTTIKVHISKELLCDIMSSSLGNSIFYDQQKQELTVRCNRMGANVATIYLIIKYLNNPLGITFIDIQKDYDSIVEKTKDTWNYNLIYDELKTLLNNHKIKYGNKIDNRQYNFMEK